jgi:hypothetical protein
MASKTTVNFDDEMEEALAELITMDDTKKLAIKRSLLAQVRRQPPRQANVARAIPFFHEHSFDESVTVGHRLAKTGPGASGAPSVNSTTSAAKSQHRPPPPD